MNWRKIVDELNTRAKAYEATGNNKIAEFLKSAANELSCARNELCMQCGNYKMAHKSDCEGCRWK